MKKLFALTLAIAASLCTFAQGVALCPNACEPVTDQPMIDATFPYYASEALSYNLNAEVDVCITFLCPETTNVNVSAPLVGNINTDATIDTLIISELSNLPAGLSYCVSTAEIFNGDYCTVHVYGTPTEAGVYNINFVGAFSGTASFSFMGMDMPIPISNRTLTLASGIVITVIDPTALAADFTASTTNVAPGGTVTFTNTSRNAESVQWLFEGGSPANSTSATTVDVTYENEGTYTVSLIATRGEETDSIGKTIVVRVPIEVNFKTHDTLVYVGDTVHFDNLSTGGYYYKWNFDVDNTYGLSDDGGTIMGSFLNSSSEENPSYAYSQEGYFSVSLTVSYNQNFFGDLVDGVTLVKRNYVHVIANPNVVMSADFEPSTYNAAVNEVISFNNLSEGYTSFIWDFGDSVEGETEEESVAGGHSEEVSPQYAYSAAGVYEVTMMAYNDYNQLISGNYPTITKSITVEDRPVEVEENAINGISVYPNPATTTINVAAEGMQNITIIDMTGRVVMSKDVNSNVETIDVAGFAKANYMVRIATASDVVVRSIVVE